MLQKNLPAQELEQALDFIIFDLGSGQTIEVDPIEGVPAHNEVARLLEACPLKLHLALDLMTACLAVRHQEASDLSRAGRCDENPQQ